MVHSVFVMVSEFFNLLNFVFPHVKCQKVDVIFVRIKSANFKIKW